MIPTIKSEYRKLFSVRSTYGIWLIAWIIIVVFGFWIEGYKGGSGSPTSLVNNYALQELVINGGKSIAGFLSIIAILFTVHEYRYNMIMYSLTASNSRSKVLAAKLIVITTFAAGFTLLSILFAFGCYSFGIHLRHVSLPHQDWNLFLTVGKVLFYNLAYTLIGVITGLVSRSLVAAIGFIFLFPSAVEGLIGLVLKTNAVYLPFSALDRIVYSASDQLLTQGALTPAKAMAVGGSYVLVGLVAAWVLFLRRDAN